MVIVGDIGKVIEDAVKTVNAESACGGQME